jgi:hypothetical protein
MCGSIASFPLVEDGQVELVEPFRVGQGVDGDEHAALIVKAPTENGCPHESIRGQRRR